ncbi:MAG: rhomboid family intramembrane serine protease [Candidatus Eremiobacteraeota bacterium]|nr:rhomboid family intramembrane serine protease [Candidatus Eremiobacteraeota bacterium]
MIPIGDDEHRLSGGSFVLYGLLFVNVYVWVLELSAPDPDAFILAYATIPYDVTHWVVLPPPSPQFPPLTIVTSMFLHGGWLHIGFNMLFLFVFGRAVEAVCGHLRFFVFYLLCGIAGGIAQVAVAPGSHVPALGASGAIAGVLGAYLVNFPFASVRTIVPVFVIPLFVRLPAIMVIGVWALTQFLDGFGTISSRAAESTGGIAYFAHIGGFLAGVLLIGLMSKKKKMKIRAW